MAYILSRYAGWSRGMYERITQGSVTIRNGKKKTSWYFKDGKCEGYTEWENGRKRMKVRYGGFLAKYDKTGKLVKKTHYVKGSACQLAPIEFRTKHTEVHENLLENRAGRYDKSGFMGKRETWKTGHCLRREKFTYDNGVVAYYIRRGKLADVKVVYPSGKVMCEFKGFELNSYNSLNLPIAHVLAGEIYNYSTGAKGFSPDGELISQGQHENGQKVGRWLAGEVETFYILGVEVSKEIFETPPEQLDPNGVLRIGNAQLRASLLSKIGFAKVVERCNAKVIAEDVEKGMAIFSIEAPTGSSHIDNTLVFLKVKCPSTGEIYYLRIPPNLRVKSCEEARLWTLGVAVPRGDAETAVRQVPPITSPPHPLEFDVSRFELVKET